MLKLTIQGIFFIENEEVVALNFKYKLNNYKVFSSASKW
jgi:hypothetical protein